MQFFVAYAIYSKLIAPLFLQNNYNKTHSKSIPLDHSFFLKMESNAHSFLALIKDYFSGVPSLLMILLLLCLLSGAFLSIKKNFNSSNLGSGKKYFSSALIILITPASFFLSFLHLSVLEYPVFAARVMVGFGVFMSFCYVIAKDFKPSKYIFALFIIYSFILSYSYGNALKAQDRFDAQLSSKLSYDISKIRGNEKYLSIAGVSDSSPILSLAQRKFPLISRLVPIYINNDWGWGVRLLQLNGINLDAKPLSKMDARFICNNGADIINHDYSIIKSNDKIIIMFKNFKC